MIWTDRPHYLRLSNPDHGIPRLRLSQTQPAMCRNVPSSRPSVRNRIYRVGNGKIIETGQPDSIGLPQQIACAAFGMAHRRAMKRRPWAWQEGRAAPRRCARGDGA